MKTPARRRGFEDKMQMLREMQNEDNNLPFMPIRRLAERSEFFPFQAAISGFLLSATQLIYISNFQMTTISLCRLDLRDN